MRPEELLFVVVIRPWTPQPPRRTYHLTSEGPLWAFPEPQQSEGSRGCDEGASLSRRADTEMEALRPEAPSWEPRSWGGRAGPVVVFSPLLTGDFGPLNETSMSSESRAFYSEVFARMKSSPLKLQLSSRVASVTTSLESPGLEVWGRQAGRRPLSPRTVVLREVTMSCLSLEGLWKGVIYRVH